MSRLLRLILIIMLPAVVVSAIGERSVACELCRMLGTTAFHDAAIGGDDPNDAMAAPPDHEEEGGGGSYVVLGGWPQPGGKRSLVTLTYSYENMFDGVLTMPNGQPLPKLLIRNSIEEALGLWASVAPLHFIEVEDDGLAYGSGSSKYGQIRFRHVYINGPDPAPPALPIAKAQAYYPYASAPLAGDVEFDHGDRWQESGTLPVPDLLGATIHELGHSIGLGHSDLPQANMYWIFTRYTGLGTGALQTDDIDGVHYLYGEGSGGVTPLPGAWQDRAILPDASSRGWCEFNDVPSGRWFDPPLVSEFRFTAKAGTLFSQIVDFPTGFASPFTVSVNGDVLGQFDAGESVSFVELPSGGVGEFTISGINPLVDVGNPGGFPLRLAFTTPTGSFFMIAIPEPATLALLLFATGGWLLRRRVR